MHEIINMILEEVRGMWRFRRYALLTAWAICLLGWSIVLCLPDKYEASARIFVDPTTALKPAIQGLGIEQDVNAELNLVRQSLLGEPQLRKVAEATGLSNSARTPNDKVDIINGLRSRINIGVQGGGQAGGDNNTPSKLYTITYQDSNRERGLRVVTLLLNNFVESTLGGKREGSQQAQKFLEEQIRVYEQRLGQAEQRLADFKRKNVGQMPGEQGDYFTRLQTEIDAVKKVQTELNTAQAKRDALRRQLRGEAPVAASAGNTTLIGNVSQSGGDTLSRIKETQAKIDEMLLRFTEKHPDIIALRQTLADLKVRRESELEALRRGDPSAAAATGASANPVYQSIQLALNQSEIEIASLRGELNNHQEKVAELKRLVNIVPEVEAEFARLNRDYSVTKGQYTALVDRLEKARLTEGAEATGSVRFNVIDPPAVGFQPVSPKRLLLLVGVLGGGVVTGIGIAYLLNLLRPVFNSIESMSGATGLPVLGAISLSRSEAAFANLRQAYKRYSISSGLLVAAFLVVVLIGSRFAPLSLHF